MRIAIISDTHGLLRPEAIRQIEGVEHILHGGDVGKPEVLEQLRRIAPVTVVRGNVRQGRMGRGIANDRRE
ncbi:MAG: metallophosphoesterase family protein [Bacteroidia bacterium]